MTVEPKLIYKSSNGDRWLLVFDRGWGQPLVRHQPSLHSGGRVSDVEIDEFMQGDGQSPQQVALRELLSEPRPHLDNQRDAAAGRPDEAGRITAAQIRGGRGLLGWSQDRLAQEAHLSCADVAACESGTEIPPYEHLAQIAQALALGGIVLIGEGEVTSGGPGVRMGALGTSTGQPRDVPESEGNDNKPDGGQRDSASDAGLPDRRSGT